MSLIYIDKKENMVIEEAKFSFSKTNWFSSVL